MPSLLQTVRFSVQTARLGETSRWSPQRVNRLAQRRLEGLVRYAVKNSPFYRDKYRRVDLSDISLDELPPTKKSELRNNFNQAVTDRDVRLDDVHRFMSDPKNLGRWYRGKYAVSHTSGSQGPPLAIVQDRRCIETLFATISARANAGAKPNIIEAARRLREPARIAVIAQERGFYPSGAAFEFLPEIAKPFVNVYWLSAMQSDLIDRLNEYQPNSLIGYASVLEALALRWDELRLDDLRQISNSSEQLSTRARRRIEDAFGVPLLDHYGMGECLLLSDGCPTNGGAHVNADWALLEIVDDDYQPVPHGSLGTKALVTNLANRVQPFIRYEVGDRLAMATTPCSCGSRLPRIERIEGRSVDLFWTEGDEGRQMLPGVLFHNAIDSLREVREWQAIQHATDRVEVRLELAAGAAPDELRLQEALRARLAVDGLPAHVALEVHVVPPLTADPSTGKFRRMVNRMS